jgi:hypothetical protein
MYNRGAKLFRWGDSVGFQSKTSDGRRAFERLGSRCTTRNEDVDVARHKLRGERREPVDFVLPPFPLDLDRLPLDIAEVPQPFEECFGAKRK